MPCLPVIHQVRPATTLHTHGFINQPRQQLDIFIFQPSKLVAPETAVSEANVRTLLTYWHFPQTEQASIRLSVCLSQHGPTTANPLLQVCCCGPGHQKISTDCRFAGHCHIVAIAADIQETTQDGTVCSQLSRLLAVATPDTCFFFFSLFPHRSHVSFSLFLFCKVSSKSLTLRHLNLFV